MQELLDRVRAFPTLALAPGEVMLREGERTGRLFVLAEGALDQHSHHRLVLDHEDRAARGGGCDASEVLGGAL